MKRPFMINVVININDDSKKWAVYVLRDPVTAEILYVGHVALNHLFTLSDLNKNPAFDRSANYIFTLHELCDNRFTAQNVAFKFVRALPTMPEMNRRATSRRGNILCDQTDEVFYTQKEAAQAHGIDAGALGRHLAGKPYHLTIKGRTYRYTDRKPSQMPEPRTFIDERSA